MPRVTLPQPRSRILETSDGLRVVIPAKRNPFIIVFLGVWMVGWAVGEFSAVRALLTGEGAFPTGQFLYLWLTGWTLGGGLAAYLWLWTFVGKEVITLRPGELVLRRDVLGIGRSREFDLEPVSNLRVAPMPYNPFDWSSALHFWGLGGGLIAFDYGSRTFRFGTAIDEAEAHQIVARLCDRHPFAQNAV